MRFTEHELTLVVTAAAKAVVAAKNRRKGADEAWEALSKYERYQVLEPVSSQVLPVLAALPDVDVEPGTRPRFSDAQILAAVEATLGEAGGGGRIRRKVTAAARVVLVRTALGQLPPRQDPDALLG